MTQQKTLLIIKPDIVKKQLIGEIISIIEKTNLKIDSIQTTTLTEDTAKSFYAEHNKKPFFEELISFMTSDKIVIIILSGEYVIQKIRTLIGNTDFRKAEKNTIRAKYATNITENAVHASDSYESAIKEIKIISQII